MFYFQVFKIGFESVIRTYVAARFELFLGQLHSTFGQRLTSVLWDFLDGYISPSPTAHRQMQALISPK